MPGPVSRWCLIWVLSSHILTGPPASTFRRLPSIDVAAMERAFADGPALVDDVERWPKVLIVDPATRDATRRALDIAGSWLSVAQCARLFSDFHDVDGQPLDARLRQLESTPADYLRLVYVHDGELHPACKRHGVLAFTQVGSRVVYVCGRDFARAWNRDRRETVATLIHETLHSLGLGENPPSPREITYKILTLCSQ